MHKHIPVEVPVFIAGKVRKGEQKFGHMVEAPGGAQANVS